MRKQKPMETVRDEGRLQLVNEGERLIIGNGVMTEQLEGGNRSGGGTSLGNGRG